MVKIKMNEMKKSKGFIEEAFLQGSKKIPLKQVKEYGTGAPMKMPKKKMKKVSRGK
jgi:hypothetical protein